MIKRWVRNWLGFRTDLVTTTTFEAYKLAVSDAIGLLDKMIVRNDVSQKIEILDNSQGDAFDAISRQATMIEEMKKDIKLLVEENIELRRNLPKPTRPVRNFTEFRTLVENQEITQNAV